MRAYTYVLAFPPITTTFTRSLASPLPTSLLGRPPHLRQLPATGSGTTVYRLLTNHAICRAVNANPPFDADPVALVPPPRHPPTIGALPPQLPV
uniref:Uncharacterized protein n=1 Tax=Oryza sativa subsp. japonica TaxID=39947 RepID=Q67V56_ORYSJ|nr:hypothetical protein [Oryza sativa Japonica Group]